MNDSADSLRSALAHSGGSPDRPQLSDEAFLQLSRTIEDASGIAFDEGTRFILERRLLPRLRALKLDSFEAYARMLLAGPGAREELVRALEQVVVRETYFFRGPQQFGAFSAELLPRIASANAATRRLRVWSAGCASGEEPYTIAMLVLASGLFGGWRVEIQGTDLSRSAITAARRALYRDNSMRAIPDAFRDRFFARENGGMWRLDRQVRGMVAFEVQNLVDTAQYAAYTGSDVIFCRNVLIYFGHRARREVVAAFYDTLAEGGYLMLGHAESLEALNTSFRLAHFETETVYQK
jgi:chemotaxis protein methyltransferase CheR